MRNFFRCFFLIVLLFSCQRETTQFSFDRLQNWSVRWEEVVEITEIHSALENEELEVIGRPPGTWIVLAKLLFHPESKNRADCLLFRPPQGPNEGILKVVQLDKRKLSCEKVLLDSTRETIGGISELKLKFKKDLFHFEIEDFDEKRTRKDIYFPNLGPLPKYERFSSSFQKNDLYGGTWLRASKKTTSSKLLGNWEDNYRDETAKVCHQLNKDCEETVEYQCDRCRYGWYPVVDSVDCEKTMKICGRNLCGQKGMPACPRGSEAMKRADQDLTLKCFEGSRAGYCEKGLNTVCDGDVLICL